jgi:hypothetical protein
METGVAVLYSAAAGFGVALPAQAELAAPETAAAPAKTQGEGPGLATHHL